jgi:hypothetical protein
METEDGAEEEDVKALDPEDDAFFESYKDTKKTILRRLGV